MCVLSLGSVRAGVCKGQRLAMSRVQFPHADLEVGNMIWWLLVRFGELRHKGDGGSQRSERACLNNVETCSGGQACELMCCRSQCVAHSSCAIRSQFLGD